MLMECAPISVLVRTSLATWKPRWNSWCKVGPKVPASPACRTASLNLAEDLRLTQHHGVQPCGNPESMTRRSVAMQQIAVRLNGIGGQCGMAGQPSQRRFGQMRGACHVQLGAVAGRQQGRFGAMAGPCGLQMRLQ
jgi:hypothetical protein